MYRGPWRRFNEFGRFIFFVFAQKIAQLLLLQLTRLRFVLFSSLHFNYSEEHRMVCSEVSPSIGQNTVLKRLVYSFALESGCQIHDRFRTDIRSNFGDWWWWPFDSPVPRGALKWFPLVSEWSEQLLSLQQILETQSTSSYIPSFHQLLWQTLFGFPSNTPTLCCGHFFHSVNLEPRKPRLLTAHAQVRQLLTDCDGLNERHNSCLLSCWVNGSFSGSFFDITLRFLSMFLFCRRDMARSVEVYLAQRLCWCYDEEYLTKLRSSLRLTTQCCVKAFRTHEV